MTFQTYDLIFLGLFLIFVIVFLSTRKKNLHRQGILYLYKTQFGVKFIDKFAKRFEKILMPARYVVIGCGYLLTIVIVWLIVQSTYLYLKFPIADTIKAPPIAPLIPYFPKLFGLESFFPPLYFTYFIIALAIVAISHEASHGIFARLEKFRIKSTGFAFLGPILGAFVEPDEKEMAKAKKFPQLSVLAAGTFANVVMTIIFYVLLAIFFTSIFSPAGAKFNSYSFSEVNVADLNVVGNSSIGESFVEVEANGVNYLAVAGSLESAMKNSQEKIIVFDDTPAIKNQIQGAIIEIDGKPVKNIEGLSSVLASYSPGDEIVVRTAILEEGKGTIAETKSYEVRLGEKEGKAFLGVAFLGNSRGGIIGFVYENTFAKVKEPTTHYTSSLGDFGWFVYYLLWWIVVINILVALFNMLPLGILDGGRFFYLTIWGITGSEKVGKKTFKVVTWLILLMFLAMMIRWVMAFF
ncbi:site-2 protease family protein [Candidatus Pacearchaeota archaeon]|nr:site-2 protease family protein [Candidatus Pacearchaeota archaeon]